MKESFVYVIAVIACVAIFIAYAILGVYMEWEHGGGVIPMSILIAVLIGTWKGILKFGIKNDTEQENSEVTVANRIGNYILVILMIGVSLLAVFALIDHF